jgi:hypothetical protein
MTSMRLHSFTAKNSNFFGVGQSVKRLEAGKRAQGWRCVSCVRKPGGAARACLLPLHRAIVRRGSDIFGKERRRMGHGGRLSDFVAAKNSLLWNWATQGRFGGLMLRSCGTVVDELAVRGKRSSSFVISREGGMRTEARSSLTWRRRSGRYLLTGPWHVPTPLSL